MGYWREDEDVEELDCECKPSPWEGKHVGYFVPRCELSGFERDRKCKGRQILVYLCIKAWKGLLSLDHNNVKSSKNARILNHNLQRRPYLYPPEFTASPRAMSFGVPHKGTQPPRKSLLPLLMRLRDVWQRTGAQSQGSATSYHMVLETFPFFSRYFCVVEMR